MPTEKEVYASHADQYELLILREDYQKNIPREIREILNPSGLDIVELGAGTGRLTRDLVKEAKYVYTCDASHHMLSQANSVLNHQSRSNFLQSIADMRQTPFLSGCADMVIAGWSFCYLTVWGGDGWQRELDKGIQEAQRLLRQDGVIILLENFGTGFESPHPPPHLKGYFEYLELKGFQSTWFRTDYQFNSHEEALTLSNFFFGSELAEKVAQNKWTILPECTGILWLKI
ncbi:MAG TPA: class I SAM-dependent methyltransferase [Pelolinea sp.]|nr:class I SAM-dependent methyltransferase [Pelolinea sp.]